MNHFSNLKVDYKYMKRNPMKNWVASTFSRATI